MGVILVDVPLFFFLCGDAGELSFLLMTGASAVALSRARCRWNVMKFHMIHACTRNTPARQLTLQQTIIRPVIITAQRSTPLLLLLARWKLTN